MKQITVIFGTRPEAIKLAPLVRGLNHTPGVRCRVCVTGQHREMLDPVLRLFEITPDCDLSLMEPDQSLSRLAGRAVDAIGAELRSSPADLVLVQGDTTTTLCAALAAFYNRVPVGHVEAGLRSGDMTAPWPEEANRVLVSRLANLHFAPTDHARGCLKNEGVPEPSIFVTGNTGIDALFIAQRRIREMPAAELRLPADLIALEPGVPLVLVTAHRRENLGPNLESICQAIALLADKFPRTHFVYPVHLNPRVRETVQRVLARRRPTIHLTEPLDYLAFVALMDRSTLILTDSGGVQEEAPSLGKPVLVMRETTERPEAVALGTVRLVGSQLKSIVENVSTLLTDPDAYRSMARAVNPYGDGRSTGRIIAACRDYLSLGSPGLPPGDLKPAKRDE